MSKGHLDVYIEFDCLGELDAGLKVVEMLEWLIEKDYVQVIESDFWIDEGGYGDDEDS